MTHDEFVTRLLAACDLDPEMPIGPPEDAILSVVHHKVTHGDARIKAAARQVQQHHEMAEGEHGARLKAEGERDELLAIVRRAVADRIDNAWLKRARKAIDRITGEPTT